MTDNILNKGNFTLPGEAGHEDLTLELARKWGADAIRDSDGTTLSPEMLELGYEIYSTICLVRADQKWPREHWDRLPQKFLMSEPVTADSDTVEIDLLENFFRDKYEIDNNHDPKKWWQVFNRTTGEQVNTNRWEFNPKTGKVIVRNVKRFRENVK